jgi:hypothetical protein
MACVGGGTQLSYADCCLPLHEGREAARDPVSLMRARYAAYVKRLPGFLVDTTHRENNDREGGTLLEETQAICKFVTFQKLTLLATENRGDEVRAGGWLRIERAARTSGPLRLAPKLNGLSVGRTRAGLCDVRGGHEGQARHHRRVAARDEPLCARRRPLDVPRGGEPGVS